MTTDRANTNLESTGAADLSFTDWEIMLGELSDGMAKLLDLDTDGPVRELYPQSLRLGLSRLATCMLRTGQFPVHSIPDAMDMMHKPVGTWNVSPPVPEVLKDLVLMEDGDLSWDAEEFIVSTPDIAGELTQRVMLRVIENCRVRGDQHSYVKFRRFIIEHPVATQMELIETLDSLSDDGLRGLLNEAYEEVPTSGPGGGDVQTCTRCGWTVVATVATNERRCSNRRCRQLDGVLVGQYPAKLSGASGVRRVRPGLARYTTQPGGLELRLYRNLSKLEGLKVALWPGFDAYDIGIEFPDGEVWAVDCKDSVRPAFLATRLSRDEFPQVGSWGRAFYVFPSYRRRLTPGYGRTFSSRWRTEDSRVDWSFDDEFLTMVQSKVRKKEKHA